MDSRIPVAWNQVTAFRLARQHLLERAPRGSLLTVARDMTGAQAQLLPAAHLSLWTRLWDLQPAHIEQALNKRILVRAACMRRTLFLVPSRDLAVFVRGAAGRAEKEIRWALGKGVSERLIDAAIDAALNSLDEPLTRLEISERVSRKLGVQPRSVHGGGWGSRKKVASVPVGELVYPVVDLLHLVGARGVVCYGPRKDGEATFVRADAWIPGWKDMPREQAEGTLLRWYLHAFGPATAADFGRWALLTRREANAIWAREQGWIAAVSVEGRSAFVLRHDLDELVGARFERPHVRLLPYFDVYMLGHRQRAHVAAAQHWASIYRPQGWVSPVVLVNGRAAAVWEHARDKDVLRIRVTGFGSLPRTVLSGLRTESQDLARFLGAADVILQVE